MSDETFDNINQNWFINAANKIKTNNYTFKPARRINIPKLGTHELRPLTIGSPRDKVIQQAIYILLQHIYEVKEKIFHNCSHGSRPSKSTHTAMADLKKK